MDTADKQRRGQRFRELHAGPEILLLPNPWDAGSARLLENLGFSGLATTSAGLAFSLGMRDGDGGVTADATFDHIAELLAATRIPISADLENGFSDTPEGVAATIRRAGEVGLAGASIEDATYQDDAPLYERSHAVERIQAAVEAARAIPHPFTLTARAENFIRGRPDLDDALWRLHAYDEAGADVLYAPGLPDEAALRLACQTVRKPLNYVVGVQSSRIPLARLRELGVRRVTLGSCLARCAFAATLRAAEEMRQHGTFEFVAGLPSVADFNQLIAPQR